MGRLFHVPLFTLTEWRKNAGASQKRGQLWIIMLLLNAIVLRLTTNYMYMQWNYHETSSNGSGARKAESWKAPTDQRKTFMVFAMCKVFHKIEGKFAFIFLCCNVYATESYIHSNNFWPSELTSYCWSKPPSREEKCCSVWLVLPLPITPHTST